MRIETRCGQRHFITDNFLSLTRNSAICQPSYKEKTWGKMLLMTKTPLKEKVH